ncbi:FMR1N protein, partial [Rhinopomastus cyanomelas]|nr:FMR1N protein [Rhinopomastus cyanomelas]
IGTHLVWNYGVLILLYSINSSFALPTRHVLERSEAAPDSPCMKVKGMYECFISFFTPTTCSHKDGQILVPCHAGEGLNSTECSKNKCCPSKSSHELKCYKPFKDNKQQTFHVLVVVGGGFVILACLPFCCGAFLKKSSCVNPLLWRNKEIEQMTRKAR